MNPTIRTLIVWVAIFVVVILLYNAFQTGRMNREQITFSEFMEDIQQGRIEEVTIRGNELSGTFKEVGGDGLNAFHTYVPEYPDLVQDLRDAGVAIKAEEPKENPLLQFLFGWAPFLLIIGLWIFFMRQMQSGGNKALSFGKSKAKLLNAHRQEGHFRGRGRRRGGQGGARRRSSSSSRSRRSSRSSAARSPRACC